MTKKNYDGSSIENGQPPKELFEQETPGRHLLFILPAAVKDHLKVVAKKLPKSCEEYDTFNRVSAIELLDQGVSQVKQRGIIKPVVVGEYYDLPAVALRDLDHEEKLKKFWRAGGLLGCHEYLNQLPAYIASMREMYPSLWRDTSGTYIGVKEGTQMLPDERYMQKLRASQQQNNIISQQ